MRRAGFAAAALVVVASGLCCRVVPRRPPRERVYVAAFKGDGPAVAALLREDPSLVTARYVEDVTLLHIAAMEGHADVAELLARNGADVDAVDDDGDTALYWAARAGHAGVVGALLARGADPRVGSDPMAAAETILIADMLREKLGCPLPADPRRRAQRRRIQDGQRQGGASGIIVVRVRPDGTYRVGGKQYELEEAGRLIKAKAEESPKDHDGLPRLAVKVEAYLDCEYADVQAVMLKCMEAHVWRLSFGAVRETADALEREKPRMGAGQAHPPRRKADP